VAGRDRPRRYHVMGALLRLDTGGEKLTQRLHAVKEARGRRCRDTNCRRVDGEIVALVTHGTDTVVYLETAPGRYLRRVVTVGDDDGATAVITSGVAPGDRVVVDGSLFLEGESARAS